MLAEAAVLQSELAKDRTAANALGDDPAFATQAADLQSEIAHLEKKVAGGKTAGKSSLAHRVERKSPCVGRETKRLEQLRRDMETVLAALIAREADLAEEKLELQKLKDELVAGSSCGGAAMEVDPNSDDEEKLKEREPELLHSFPRDATARMGEGANVPELSKIQRSLERGRRRIG